MITTLGGQQNIYMANYKCHVTGSRSTKRLAKAKPPTYCKDDPNKCVNGAKQMIVWHRRYFPDFGEVNWKIDVGLPIFSTRT